MNNKRTCPICGKEFEREDMTFSLDCHGIPYRLICFECEENIMEERGFDGEYYSEFDECIDEDY